MLWASFEIIKSIATSIISSRIGQFGIVALVSWFWATHETNVKWRSIIAAEKAQIEALYRAELQRQEKAIQEIEQLASKRESENIEVVADMKATIEEYMKKVKEQPNVVAKTRVVHDCPVDSEFADVVRKLDSTRARKANPPARTNRVR